MPLRLDPSPAAPSRAAAYVGSSFVALAVAAVAAAQPAPSAVPAAPAAGPAAAPAAALPADDARHERIVAALRARDPVAADAYDRARDRAEHLDAAGAAELLEEAHRRLPDSGDVLVAQSEVAFRQDDEERALSLARQAVATDRSVASLASLSRLLVQLRWPSPEQIDEAARLAEEAVERARDEPWPYEARLVVAVRRGRAAEARRAADELAARTDATTAARGIARGARLATEIASGDGDGAALGRELMDRATALAPDEVHVLATRVIVEVGEQNWDGAAATAQRITALEPDSPLGYAMLAYASVDGGDFEAAEEAIDQAQARGMDEESAERMRGAVSTGRAIVWVVLGILVTTPIGLYVGTIVLLLLAGWLLSRMTLRAASRLPTERSGRASGMAGWLRWSYRLVLWLCCAFYYASLPLLVLGIVLLVAAVFFAVLMVGYVPIKLLVILGLFALVSIWVTVKSVFVRGRDEDPGVLMDLDAHPRFAGVLREVAERVGTRPVDSVYLTPTTDIAVTERGGLFKQLRRKTERCLILGVGVLEGMTVQQLKAILAHEHGHFKNEDTAGGAFALAVRRSLHTMAIGLLEGGVASKLNPAWWFTIGFSKLFARISQGASRLQEVLADRWAAYAYGSEAFVAGLRHVIAQSARFDAHTAATLEEVVGQSRPLSNFYRYEAEQPIDEGEVERAIEEMLEREPSAYDSHPAPRDRIAWAQALGAEGEGAPDPSEAWSLFADRDRIEQLMTDEIRAGLALSYGVAIPRATAEP